MDWLQASYYGNFLAGWQATAAALTRRFRQRRALCSPQRFAARTGSGNSVNPFAAATLAGKQRWLSERLTVTLGTGMLALPRVVRQAAEHGTRVIVPLQVARQGHPTARLIDRYTARYHGIHAGNTPTMPMPVIVPHDILWSTIMLMLLANLGVNTTTLATSLGIIAVAGWLALRNIFGEPADSSSIAHDRLFVLGDFIDMRDTVATVERVALRAPAVRILSGEQIIFPNNPASHRIHDYKYMTERCNRYRFGVAHQTSPQKMRIIPPTVREIGTSDPKTWFYRAHFKKYGSGTLMLPISYLMRDSDCNLYMDIRAINFALPVRFAQKGVALANSTQTAHVLSGASQLFRRFG